MKRYDWYFIAMACVAPVSTPLDRVAMLINALFWPYIIRKFQEDAK